MHLPPDMFLKVIEPLYGTPESKCHWYLTYLEHYSLDLDMIQSRVDTWHLFQSDSETLSVMMFLPVDDSVIVGTEIFL